MTRRLLQIVLFWPALFLSAGLCISQEQNFNRVEQFLSQSKFDSVQIELNHLKLDLLTDYQKGLYDFYKGYTYKRQDKHGKAFQHLLNAEKIFEKLELPDDQADTNYELYELLTHQQSLKIDPQPFLNKYINHAKSSQDPLRLARAYSKIAEIHFNTDFEKTILFYHRSISELKKIPDTLRINSIELNIGAAYNKKSRNLDSALYYFRKTLPYFIKIDEKNAIANNYNNQARAYEELLDTIKAIDYYKNALSVDLSEYNKKSTALYLDNLIRCYKTIKDYPNAYNYAEKLIELNIKIDDQSQNEALIDAEKKYRAAEKDKQRLKNQNIAIALGGGLIGVSLIGFLLFKNTKRKQRIAEQGREIEIQKTEKILKEQELTTIDAMISGQEKERQRLAGDLHDSVGATLAAAKMQFNHLKGHKDTDKDLDELYTSTGDLLEQAYQEIRSMAHLKNSGVIAKNGLLPAIEKLAKNASATKSLTVEVQGFGLDERLDNLLEISIFRIIQELVTNIIKHANASEASISITNHDASLSIIVEDNGSGFDPKTIQKKEGMGLSSIERRVEHLEGTMEVDSTIGIGTSILIDIPI